MTGQHFKELLETVCMTTGTTKTKISSLLGVTPWLIWYWQKNGVPKAIKPYVMSVLHSVMFKERQAIGG